MGKKAEVLLLKPLQGKGNAGDIIDVKMHYANYVLIPQGIGIYYDKQAKNQHTAHQKKVEAYKAQMKLGVEELANKLKSDGISFEKAATDTDTLYDSISNRTLAQYVLKHHSLTVTPDSFGLEQKIEAIGEFETTFTYEDISVPFTITVKKISE